MSFENTAAYSTFSAAYSIGFSKRRKEYTLLQFLLLTKLKMYHFSKIFQEGDSPGPQAYGNINLNVSKRRQPEWKMTESKKVSMFDVHEILPSPGSYEIQTNIGQGSAYTIQAPNEHQKEPTKISPALYSPNIAFVKKSLPAISLTSRQAPNIKKTFEETPGVGSYDIIQKKQVTKGVHNLFGFAQKDSIYKNDQINNPAPNQYLVNDATLIQSPSFRFQKSKRNEMINPQYEQNGPGSYNINRDFIQTKYTSNSPSHQNSQSQQSQQNSSHGFKKSISESKFEYLNVPGPGTYELTMPSVYKSSYFKSSKFGLSPRQTDMASNKNPGPGAYQIDTSKDQKKFRTTRIYTFGETKKETTLESSETPGPGQLLKQFLNKRYNIPPIIGKGPAYAINKSISNQPSFIKKSESPGPAAYAINESQIKPSPFSVKFNSKTEGNDTFRSQLPGPGHYELQEDSFRKSKISFTQSAIRDAFGIKEGPGPSSYDIKSQIAGLPDYHKRQMEYFQNKIKMMRETMRDSGSTKGFKSTKNSLQKSISVQKQQLLKNNKIFEKQTAQSKRIQNQLEDEIQ